ncbi:hypothetical protein, partial [Streptomyces sp. NPDC004658]|uniref:hypothetical protein n=1 Tax=Streptomyces sp. NPDC004658 TaxID=3154672 RepID=UPI0033AE3585
MLRILDARTGEPVPAAPARRGLTRIETHASGLDPTALRVLLTADLLVRALELGGTPVWTILTAPRDKPELRTAATRLAIRPFEDDRDLASGLGEAQVIHVARWPATGGSGAAPGERDEIPAEDAAPGEPAPARASEQRGEGPSAAVARGERAEGPAAGAPGGPAARPTPPVAPEEPEDEAPAAVARGQRGETPTTPAVTPGERTGRPGAAARPQARAAGAT